MKKLSILIFSLLTVGCITGYNPDYYFNEVQAVNLSGASVADVNIRVVDTQKSLSCAAVAWHAMCDDRFGKRRFPQQGIELS